MLKIAVLADLHLTDNPRSVKLRVLDWALQEIRNRNADLIAGIGDLTATGSRIQNDYLTERLSACGFPFCWTPGNADCRSGENQPVSQTRPPEKGIPLFFVDSSRSRMTPEDISALEALPDGAGFLMATHCPPEHYPSVQKDLIQKALKRHAVTAVIAGHVHNDGEQTMRGLDPDKASGGPPMISFFTRNEDGSWERKDSVMPGVDPVDWLTEERRLFRDVLGLSCMKSPFEILPQAAELHIPAIELRYDPLIDLGELRPLLFRWRQNGGRILSMHLPSLKVHDPAADHFFSEAVSRTIALGCDRVTLHVPSIRASEYPALKERLLNIAFEELMPLIDRKIQIGIENLHTIGGDGSPDHRNFGCCMEECADWIAALRKILNSDLIGFHFDIGHARNNAPFSSTQNVCDYYNHPGLPINGFHFHQVTQNPDGSFENHAALTGFYEKLICLSGYFIARMAGELNVNAPVFLEQRITADQSISLWKRLQGIIG